MVKLLAKYSGLEIGSIVKLTEEKERKLIEKGFAVKYEEMEQEYIDLSQEDEKEEEVKERRKWFVYHFLGIKNKIYNFKGANRRYQVIYDKGIKIIDDYAHHPTEIKVTIEAAKKNEGKKVNVIFQPHRYSRTKFFLDDFVEALKLADKLILMPIYSAGEENIYDITSEKLAEMVGKDVLVCEKEEIEEIVKNNKESNEIFIFMGAGSVSKVAHDITNKL